MTHEHKPWTPRIVIDGPVVEDRPIGLHDRVVYSNRIALVIAITFEENPIYDIQFNDDRTIKNSLSRNEIKLV